MFSSSAPREAQGGIGNKKRDRHSSDKREEENCDPLSSDAVEENCVLTPGEYSSRFTVKSGWAEEGWFESIQDRVTASKILELKRSAKQARQKAEMMHMETTFPEEADYRMVSDTMKLALNFKERSWSGVTHLNIGKSSPSDVVMGRFLGLKEYEEGMYFYESIVIDEDTLLVNLFETGDWEKKAFGNQSINKVVLVSKWKNDRNGEHYMLLNSIYDEDIVSETIRKNCNRIHGFHFMRTFEERDEHGDLQTKAQMYTLHSYEDGRKLNPPSFPSGSFQTHQIVCYHRKLDIAIEQHEKMTVTGLPSLLEKLRDFDETVENE